MAGEQQIRRGRLTGWPAIARYLEVDARTVQRWEADDRLPLPVFNNAKDLTVVAFMDDLDKYREARANLPRRGEVQRKKRPSERERAA